VGHSGLGSWAPTGTGLVDALVNSSSTPVQTASVGHLQLIALNPRQAKAILVSVLQTQPDHLR